MFSKKVSVVTPNGEHTVTGQLADKPTRGRSSRGLVNSPKCLIYNLQYIIALGYITQRTMEHR